MATRRSGLWSRALARAPLLGFLALASCETPPTAPPDSFGLSVHPAQQWAGGVVEVSGLPGGLLRGDVVLADGDTMELLSMEGDSFTGRLPTAANGPVRIEVRRADQRAGSGETEAFGLEEIRRYPVEFSPYAFVSAVPVEWGLAVTGFGGLEDGRFSDLAWIHLSTGQVRQFSGAIDGPSILKRVGVDPVDGTLYWQWNGGPDLVRRGRIVGGQLLDLGWVERPCCRYGCEPLLDDIWFHFDWPSTCRVTTTPTGDECERWIASEASGEPLRLVRLWSRDVAIVESCCAPPVFHLSTGEIAYSFGPEHPTGTLGRIRVATDEARGLFYIVQRRTREGFKGWEFPVLALRGEDGTIARSFVLSSSFDGDAEPPLPEITHDPGSDVLLIHREDSKALEIRDAASYELRGEVSLASLPPGYIRVPPLIDGDTNRAYLVISLSSPEDPGYGMTAAASLRLLR